MVRRQDSDGDVMRIENRTGAVVRFGGMKVSPGAVIGDARAQPRGVSVPTDRDAIMARLDAAGIEYDGRWGLARLQALLPVEG